MKRLMPIILWFLLVGAAGAEPGGVSVPGFGPAESAVADGIGLVGPATAKAGEEITVRLTGTPPLDLTLPLIDQLSWLMGDSRMYCYLLEPSQPMTPLDVRGELVFGATGATMQPLLRIQCGSPGEYRVIVDWNHNQHQLAEHRITIGGITPTPVPIPPEPDPPDPTPPPPGLLTEMWVIAVEDRKTRTAEHARVLLDPTVKQWMADNGHHLRVTTIQQPAPDLTDWISRATAQTEIALPILFIADSAGEVCFEADCPIGPIQFLSLVKKWGAEK